MREIIADTRRLHTLNDSGAGVVHNPFDKRMHAASCPTIRRMRASAESPKWFFIDYEEAAEFLASHARRYPTATWEVARCCRGLLPRTEKTVAPGSDGAARWKTSGAPPEQDRAEPPIVRADPTEIVVWTDHDVRNDTVKASPAGRLRDQLCAWLRSARPATGELLEASYGGIRRRDADVENILFNNLDQTASAYRNTCAHGLRFSWLGEDAPPDPGGERRPYYYRYRLVPSSAAMPGVRLGDRYGAGPTSR